MKTYLSFNALLFFLIIPFLGSAQLTILTGTITNQETGNILQSVNILESNSGIGTISNTEGTFSLMLKPGKTDLIITRQGFKDFSQKMFLKSDTAITVTLLPIVELKMKQKNNESRKTALITKEL